MRTKGAKNKPKLVLRELPNTGVHVPTKAKYNELMDIYTKAGWKWRNGEKPAEWNGWKDEEAETVISVFKSFGYSSVPLSRMCADKIITLSQFKKLQGLEPAKKRGRPKKILSDFGEAKLFFSNTFGQPEIEPLKIRRGWIETTKSYEDILPSPREMFNKINEIISSLKKQ